MEKVSGFLKSIEKLLLVVPLVLLCLLIVVQIFMRTFFQSGFPWLEEFGRFIFVFGTFLGASIAVGTDDHPRMTAVLVAVPHKVRQIIKMVGDLICFAALVVIDYFAWIQIQKMTMLGTMASTMPIPMYVAYLIMPITLATMALRYAICFVLDFKLFLKPSADDSRSDDASTQEGGNA